MRLSDDAGASRRTVLTGGTTLIATALLPADRAAAGDVERADLAEIFTKHGAAGGTCAVFEPVADRTFLVDAKRAAVRFPPASTFKIANSLIALETGVVKSVDEIVPYGGKPQPNKAWERDMSLREAIAMSNVPIYQEIARRIGLERYRTWLEQLDYGNRESGSVVDRFWLDGPLVVSAIEQAQFLSRLALGALPVSPATHKAVRDILRNESKDGATLYAKTGWFAAGTPKLGWWTGWVEEGSRVTTFALHMEMATAEEGPKRIAIGKAILARTGVW